MIYDKFLELINQEINNQSNYQSLCRFCLERYSNGVDVSSEYAEAFTLQDNYFTITKQCLQITSEHPNFICSACEHRLSDIASFIQEIIENGQHWEIYLENEKDVKPERIEEIDCNNHQECVDVSTIIKDENCETNFNNVIEANVSYPFDSSTLSDKLSSEHGDGLTTSEQMQIDTNNKKSRKRKRNTKKVTFRTQPTTMEYDRTCKFCDTPTFATLKQFYRHQDREHPGKRCFSCDICGSNFSSKTSTYSHMKDKHWKSGRKYHCQYCVEVFFKCAALNRHEKSVHLNARPYRCHVCAKTFTTKQTLDKHMRSTAHSEFLCTVCNASFDQSSHLSVHFKREHPNTKPPFQCVNCDKCYFERWELAAHVQLHKQQKKCDAQDNRGRFLCTVCNSSFDESSHLSVHFHREHPNAEPPFQCSFCDKCFFEHDEMASHVQLHKEQNREMRDSQHTIIIHKLIHSDVPRPFVCNVCNASFHQSSYLTVHFRREHPENRPPYQCSFCDKCYFEHDEMASHVQLHKQQKKVKCNVCSDDVASLQYLKTHMLRKHPDHVAYDCKFCKKEFPSSMILNIHLLKYHKSELDVKIKFK